MEICKGQPAGVGIFPLRTTHRVRDASEHVASRQTGRQRSQGDRAQPLLRQRAPEIQPYGTLAQYPIALDERVRAASVEALNQILADTMMLRDLYKKHHWQVAGHTFYQLHLLLEKHYSEQSKLVDALAERIQSLGGISVAVSHDVAEMTRIERPPRGREEVPVQLSRLLEAHELILQEARQAAKKAAEAGDDGTNDLLVSGVIRTHGMEVWFLAEHLVDTPPVRAE
jgi:starvation-inducible DNA-binding protein